MLCCDDERVVRKTLGFVVAILPAVLDRMQLHKMRRMIVEHERTTTEWKADSNDTPISISVCPLTKPTHIRTK